MYMFSLVIPVSIGMAAKAQVGLTLLLIEAVNLYSFA